MIRAKSIADAHGQGHGQGLGPWVMTKAMVHGSTPKPRPRAWDMGQGHGPLAMGHSPWSWVSVKGRGPSGCDSCVRGNRLWAMTQRPYAMAVGGSWPWCVVMLHGHGFRTMQAMAKGQGKAKGQGNGPWRLLMLHGLLSSVVAMGHGLGCWHCRMSRPWDMLWHVAKGPGHGHGRGPKGHVDGRLWSRVVAISCVRDHGQSYGHGQGYSQGRGIGGGGWHTAENMT